MSGWLIGAVAFAGFIVGFVLCALLAGDRLDKDRDGGTP